ncbi:hypothetical protein BJX70DRAFT_128678 [Aspergillus crustosus]
MFIDNFLRMSLDESSVRVLPTKISFWESQFYDPLVLGNSKGPLQLTFPHYVQAFGTWATKALQVIGIPMISDSQSSYLLEQSYFMFTMNTQTMIQESPETSFLRKALYYSNYSCSNQPRPKGFCSMRPVERTPLLSIQEVSPTS